MRRWYEPRNDRPDLPKNAPKKKGLVRFAESLWREFFGLLKLNLLFLLTCIPIVTIPAALTAMSRITVTMEEDENYFLWTDYKKAFLRDFGKSLAGGVLILLALALFGLSTWFYYQMGLDNRFFVIIAAVSACMLLCLYMASLYFFPMLAMVELPLKKLLLNSFVLVFVNIKRSLPALLLCLTLGFLGLGLLPYSAPFVLFIQFSLTSLIASFLLYPAIARRVLGEEPDETPDEALPEETIAEELHSAELGDFPE